MIEIPLNETTMSLKVITYSDHYILNELFSFKILYVKIFDNTKHCTNHTKPSRCQAIVEPIIRKLTHLLL